MKSTSFKLGYSILIIIITLTASNSLSTERVIKNGDLLYSSVYNLVVRDDKQTAIAKLETYESVLYLRHHSPTKESISIQDSTYNDYRYFIQTKHGVKGWVFGGGLKKVKLINPNFKEIATSCFYANSNNMKNLSSSTIKQKEINGSEIYKYLKILQDTLQDKSLVYKRPIYESGCLGILEEKCYESNILEREFEGGSEIYLFGEFKPFLGIRKGMRKQDITKILGTPSRYNKQISIYETSYMHKDQDYEVLIDYWITINFDETENIKSISIGCSYNEDC